MFEDIDKKLKDDPELRKHYQQEKLILDVTELIDQLMERKKANRTQLAELLGKGKSHVTQLLDGTSNMTLRTIADVFTVLDSELTINSVSLSVDVGQSNVYKAKDETQFEVLLPTDMELTQTNWIPTEKERAAA